MQLDHPRQPWRAWHMWALQNLHLMMHYKGLQPNIWKRMGEKHIKKKKMRNLLGGFEELNTPLALHTRWRGGRNKEVLDEGMLVAAEVVVALAVVVGAVPMVTALMFMEMDCLSSSAWSRFLFLSEIETTFNINTVSYLRSMAFLPAYLEYSGNEIDNIVSSISLVLNPETCLRWYIHF